MGTPLLCFHLLQSSCYIYVLLVGLEYVWICVTGSTVNKHSSSHWLKKVCHLITLSTQSWIIYKYNLVNTQVSNRIIYIYLLCSFGIQWLDLSANVLFLFSLLFCEWQTMTLAQVVLSYPCSFTLNACLVGFLQLLIGIFIVWRCIIRWLVKWWFIIRILIKTVRWICGSGPLLWWLLSGTSTLPGQ